MQVDHLVAKFLTNAISNKCMWCHLFTKFASYKVPPVMVSTQGSVVPLAMFAFVFVFVFIVAVFIMTVVSPMGNSQTQKLFALNNIKISTCNISSAVSAP